MAQKTVISLLDDITGEPATETIRFGLDGAQYEIDLNEEHANGLRTALAPFVTAARRAKGTAPSGGRRGTRPAADTSEIRAWARVNGWPDLSDRGRIGKDILTAYNAAQGGTETA